MEKLKDLDIKCPVCEAHMDVTDEELKENNEIFRQYVCSDCKISITLTKDPD